MPTARLARSSIAILSLLCASAALGLEGFELTIFGPCPGTSAVEVAGATPGGQVALGWSFASAPFTIPGGSCAGVTLDLEAPKLLTTLTADASGIAAIDTPVPGNACGALLQAVDLSTCATSPIVMTGACSVTTGVVDADISLIPIGDPDDEWEVTMSPDGGAFPRKAEVIAANPAWLTIPGSQWISDGGSQAIGTFKYETCWCGDPEAQTNALFLDIRSDNEGEVFLNGNSVGTTAFDSFSDPIPTPIRLLDLGGPGSFFNPDRNCLTVEVFNRSSATGFNLAGSVTGCKTGDLVDDANSGVDLSGTFLPVGSPDDEWNVTEEPGGGTFARPADVVTLHPGWDSLPGSQWISADQSGPIGDYVYEKCFCLDEAFDNPRLSMDLLADDSAEVFLNGTSLGSTPTSAFQLPATHIETTDPSLFHVGENCVEVKVSNSPAIATGVNISAEITADGGKCCNCPTGLPN